MHAHPFRIWQFSRHYLELSSMVPYTITTLGNSVYKFCHYFGAHWFKDIFILKAKKLQLPHEQRAILLYKI